MKAIESVRESIPSEYDITVYDINEILEATNGDSLEAVCKAFQYGFALSNRKTDSEKRKNEDDRRAIDAIQLQTLEDFPMEVTDEARESYNSLLEAFEAYVDVVQKDSFYYGYVNGEKGNGKA